MFINNSVRNATAFQTHQTLFNEDANGNRAGARRAGIRVRASDGHNPEEDQIG
jgi:hypothetical protein